MRISRLQLLWFFVPVLIMGSGCFSVTDPDYKTRLTKMPSFLIDHFPSQLLKDESSTFITNTDTTSHCIYYFLLQYDQDFDTKPATSYLSQKVLANYPAGDTNIIAIKRETVTYWNPEKKKFYTDKTRDNKYYYPVPYFETETLHFYKGDAKDIYSDETPSGLSKDFIIYVFDFKPGDYWQGLKPLEYLPKGWENGYSKGIAINKTKKVLINWFVVW